jgi:hypothetical protein
MYLLTSFRTQRFVELLADWFATVQSSHEFKTHFFSHFSELKIRVRVKFEVLFFSFLNSRKTIGLAEGAVNFRDSEMYFLEKIVGSYSKFFKIHFFLYFTD